MKRRIVTALFGVFLLAVIAYGASTITETWRVRVPEAEIPGLMKRVEYGWTADTATSAVSNAVTKQLVGKIQGVTFTADSSVAAGYDVTLLDEDSQDLLQGKGADLTTATTSYTFQSPSPVCGLVTVTVANTTGTGEVILFLE